ncbi:MAG: hypothetical protein RMK80_03110 [Pseudobdellovibrionaceae bacterium]|nr:hypothetical protein [Pseudobdellovibrionaceae bacterium]
MNILTQSSKSLIVLGGSFGLLLILSFQNCSQQSHFGGLNALSGNSFDTSSNGRQALQQEVGLRVLSAEAFINCFDDQVQIGGVCNTGNSSRNFIRYWLTYQGVRQPWGQGNNQVSQLETAHCDNGRWSAIVPKPNSPAILNNGTNFVEFDAHFQLVLYDEKKQAFTESVKAPAFVIQIQQNGACQ